MHAISAACQRDRAPGTQTSASQAAKNITRGKIPAAERINTCAHGCGAGGGSACSAVCRQRSPFKSRHAPLRSLTTCEQKRLLDWPAASQLHGPPPPRRRRRRRRKRAAPVLSEFGAGPRRGPACDPRPRGGFGQQAGAGLGKGSRQAGRAHRPLPPAPACGALQQSDRASRITSRLTSVPGACGRGRPPAGRWEEAARGVRRSRDGPPPRPNIPQSTSSGLGHPAVMQPSQATRRSCAPVALQPALPV